MKECWEKPHGLGLNIAWVEGAVVACNGWNSERAVSGVY